MSRVVNGNGERLVSTRRGWFLYSPSLGVCPFLFVLPTTREGGGREDIENSPLLINLEIETESFSLLSCCFGSFFHSGGWGWLESPSLLFPVWRVLGNAIAVLEEGNRR